MYFFGEIWIFWNYDYLLLFLYDITLPIEPITAHKNEPITIIIQYGCHKENTAPNIRNVAIQASIIIPQIAPI